MVSTSRSTLTANRPINVIGITDEVVKRKVIESVKTRRVDELALTKTHLKGTGMEGCEDGALSGMWEG